MTKNFLADDFPGITQRLPDLKRTICECGISHWKWMWSILLLSLGLTNHARETQRESQGLNPFLEAHGFTQRLSRAGISRRKVIFFNNSSSLPWDLKRAPKRSNHSFIMYLLSPYYAPGPLWGAKNKRLNKTHKVPCVWLYRAFFRVTRQITRQTNT